MSVQGECAIYMRGCRIWEFNVLILANASRSHNSCLLPYPTHNSCGVDKTYNKPDTPPRRPGQSPAGMHSHASRSIGLANDAGDSRSTVSWLHSYVSCLRYQKSLSGCLHFPEPHLNANAVLKSGILSVYPILPSCKATNLQAKSNEQQYSVSIN